MYIDVNFNAASHAALLFNKLDCFNDLPHLNSEVSFIFPVITILSTKLNDCSPFGLNKNKCEKAIEELKNSQEFSELLKAAKKLIAEAKGLSAFDNSINKQILELENMMGRAADDSNFEDKLMAVKKLKLKVARIVKQIYKEMQERLVEFDERQAKQNQEIVSIRALYEHMAQFQKLLNESFSKLQAEYDKLKQQERFFTQGLQAIGEELERVNLLINKDVKDLAVGFANVLDNLQIDPAIAKPHLQYIIKDITTNLKNTIEQDIQSAIDEVRADLGKAAEKVAEALHTLELAETPAGKDSLEEGALEEAQKIIDEHEKQTTPEAIQKATEEKITAKIDARLQEEIDRVLKEPLKSGENLDEKLKLIETLRTQLRDEYKKFMSENKSKLSNVAGNLSYEQTLKITEASYKKSLEDLQVLKRDVRDRKRDLQNIDTKDDVENQNNYSPR